MPLISGNVFLPDGLQARRLVYHVSLHTDGGYAIDSADWREGTTRVETDRRTGYAEQEFPARSGDDYYDLRVELLDGDMEDNFLPPLDQPPWSFQLTADTTWKEIIEAPSTVPITPSMVAQMQELLDEANDLLGQAELDLTTKADKATTINGHDLSVNVTLTPSDVGAQVHDTDLDTISALNSAQAGVIASDGSGWFRKTYAQLKTALGLTKADVGLSAVDNTSDLAKPISNATATALAAKADLVGGTVPANQLPSFVDDVLEFANLAAFPAIGESGKIYVALDTNLTYRWTGSTYGVLDPSLALGETAQTAYRGDRGKTAYDHSQITSGNPHGTSKSDVGLGSVTNDAQVKASDVDTDSTMAANSDGKVASQKATKTALALKANVTEMPPTPERYGAAGNGVTDDTTALAAWAASGASGLSLRPGSVYLTTATISPLSSTKGVAGNNAIIKAAGTIADAMWKTPGSGTRLEYATIQDIIFDCNQQALTALKLRWAGRVDLNNLVCLDSTGDGFQLGDSTATARSFGIRAHGLRADRIQAAGLAAGSRGEFIDAADDGRMIDPVLVGYETGMRNNGGAWKFFAPHAYGHTATTLPITCFDDNGPDNEYYGMEADSPSAVGLRLRNGRTKVIGGRVYANAFITDNTIVGIQVDPSPYDLTLSGVAFVAVDATHRIATDIVGDLSIANISGTMWSAGTHVVTQNAIPRMRNVLTASVNGATTLSRPVIEPRASTTLAANGAVTINSATCQFQQVFLQANATSSTITNPNSGGRLTIQWSQDATGGRTYAWPTDCRFVGNSAPSDTTPNRSTSVTFLRQAGNIWSEVSRAVAVPIS